MRSILAAMMFVVVQMNAFTMADNWGHWRGPDGNGVAPHASPPTEWSSTKNIRWKVDIPGKENSSPVVWEQSVFVTTAEVVEPAGNQGSLPKMAFKLLCFNRKDGKLVWEQTATIAQPHQGVHQTTGFASASPCTDGQHIYAHFGSQGLFCYSMDGQLKWKREDFGKMKTLNDFGEGSSPTIEGDMILVPWDHEGPSALYALNRLTGETIWKTDRDEPTGWATPLVVEHAGQKQVIMNGQNFARSYDLVTGKEIWRCTGQTVRPVSTPVAEKGLVFVGSGFQRSYMGAFRLDGKGDIKGTDHVVWEFARNDRMMTDMASPLLSSGRIYFHKAKDAMLSCVDAATGNPYYMAQRIPGLNGQAYASPVAAGGFIYLTSTEGTTAVIKDAQELTVVATNSLGEFVGGTPAPIDNELFIRSQTHLFCIAE